MDFLTKLYGKIKPPQGDAVLISSLVLTRPEIAIHAAMHPLDSDDKDHFVYEHEGGSDDEEYRDAEEGSLKPTRPEFARLQEFRFE